jgi:hypothetical protein
LIPQHRHLYDDLCQPHQAGVEQHHLSIKGFYGMVNAIDKLKSEIEGEALEWVLIIANNEHRLASDVARAAANL